MSNKAHDLLHNVTVAKQKYVNEGGDINLVYKAAQAYINYLEVLKLAAQEEGAPPEIKKFKKFRIPARSQVIGWA